MLTGNTDQVFYADPHAKRIEWTNVPYWSVRKAILQSEESEKLGKFEVTGTSDLSGWKGELINSTTRDLTNVHIFFRMQTVKIGDMKAGEKKAFALPASSVQPGYIDIGGLMFPRTGGQDPYNRERELVQSYYNRLVNQGQPKGPVAIGWSTNETSAYQVNGKAAHADVLTMWTQELDMPTVQGGKVTIPSGMVAAQITSASMREWGTEPNGMIHANNGELTMEYRLPRNQGAQYDKLQVKMDGNTGPVSLQIWNEGNQAWESLDLSGGPWQTPEPAPIFSMARPCVLKRRLREASRSGVRTSPWKER
ncbi:hypothetical protein N6H14_33555 [Paenibacillus sp. CC-CFT747]|nr:hypothetical protein N6H14_33555 [Paenibacillus sp. CC-CFT747]